MTCPQLVHSGQDGNQSSVLFFVLSPSPSSVFLFQACSTLPEGPTPGKFLPSSATSPRKVFGCLKLGPHAAPSLRPSPGLSSSSRNPWRHPFGATTHKARPGGASRMGETESDTDIPNHLGQRWAGRRDGGRGTPDGRRGHRRWALKCFQPPGGGAAFVPTFHMSEQAHSGAVTSLRSCGEWKPELGWGPRPSNPEALSTGPHYTCDGGSVKALPF